jgi:hypothetical protein
MVRAASAVTSKDWWIIKWVIRYDTHESKREQSPPIYAEANQSVTVLVDSLATGVTAIGMNGNQLCPIAFHLGPEIGTVRGSLEGDETKG